MARKWHYTGPWNEPVIIGDQALVALYRTQIDQIKRALNYVYTEYESAGIVDYAEMSRTSNLDPVLLRVNELLKETFRVRARIVNDDIQRAAVSKYDDCLYQLERIVRTRVGKRGKIKSTAPVGQIMEAVYGNRDSLDTRLGKLDTRAIRETETVIRAGIQNEQTLDEITTSVSGVINRDLGRVVQVNHSIANAAINSAAEIAFKTLPQKIADKLDIEVERLKLIKVWIHDEPRHPRRGHCSMHGQVMDDDGLFINPITGKTTTAPGLFGDPSEDENCRCSIQIMTVDEYMRELPRLEKERATKLANAPFSASDLPY